MKTELRNKILKLCKKVENGETKILIEDACDIDSMKKTAFDGMHGSASLKKDENIKALNEVVDSCLRMKEQYTTIFNDLSIMILKDGELELFMIVNALNEVAVIKEMGSTHFLFKTDWKETIWRKKIVKAANRYLDYADRDYLNKTIKYIAKLEFFDFTVDFSSIDIKDECKRVITTNIELCNKFNLDISTMEKTRNPFDNF